MKLTAWCKKNGIAYITGFRWFHAGKIEGAYQMDTGTILVPDTNPTPTNNSFTAIYCRVSNNSRRKELEYQVERCLTFATAKGLTVDGIFKEVGSGMNDNRKRLWDMLDKNPTTIIVENKDRLTRFGFEYLKRLLNGKCEIIVMTPNVNDETDLIKDLVSVITSFCCRLYGMRRGYNKAKKIKEEIEKLNDQNVQP